MNRIILALVAAIMFGGTSTAATASCVIEGTVSSVTAVDSGGPSFHVISVRRGSLSRDIYVFETTDQGLVEVALTAMTAQMQTQLEGDAVGCIISGGFIDGGSLVEMGFL